MGALFNLLAKFWKGVIGVLRLSFFLLILFIVFLSSGWIKIVCVPEKIKADVENGVQNLKIMISGLQGEGNHWQRKQNEQHQQKKYFIIEHRLQPGENLLDLQAAYGTHWRVIQKFNHIEDPRKLRPGQVLRIPILRDYG